MSCFIPVSSALKKLDNSIIDVISIEDAHRYNDEDLFKNFLMIEEFRDDIVKGKKVDIIEEDCKKLYEGICSEFYFLLKQFYILFQKNVAMHFEKNLNFHQYDDRVMLDNLSNEVSVDLNVDI